MFRTIYRRHTWGGTSVSGGGSDLARTVGVRTSLPTLLREIGARHVLDAPCGDFHWMSQVRLDVYTYIGMDIVPELISQNEQRYGADGVRFLLSDITQDELPRVDLILCRDCMVHLSSKDIFRCLRNFKKSGSQYLLATTYPGEVRRHRNIVTGMWRLLDLQMPPFRFPEPLQILDDSSDDEFDRKKRLGLWKIQELPV